MLLLYYNCSCRVRRMRLLFLLFLSASTKQGFPSSFQLLLSVSLGAEALQHLCSSGKHSWCCRMSAHAGSTQPLQQPPLQTDMITTITCGSPRWWPNSTDPCPEACLCTDTEGPDSSEHTRYLGHHPALGPSWAAVATSLQNCAQAPWAAHQEAL